MVATFFANIPNVRPPGNFQITATESLSLTESALIQYGGTPDFEIFEVKGSNRLHEITVPLRTGIDADFKNVRFCLNPYGTDAEKLFIQHFLVANNTTDADFLVGSQSLVTDKIYAIWITGLEDKSDPYATYNAAGHYFNNFSRAIWHDVGKYYYYDKKPFDDAFWPACVESPLDNVSAVMVAKTTGGDNSHGATDSTYVFFSKTEDRGQTWSATQNIFPAIYISAVSKYLVFMNAVTTWVDDGSPNGLITVIANSNLSASDGNPTTADSQEYSRPWITQSSDFGVTWTTPEILIDTNDYCGLGGKGFQSASDGLQVAFGHCDFPISAPNPYAYCFYSFDNWVTRNMITYQETAAYLNETSAEQLKDTNGDWKNEAIMFIRDDSDSLSFTPPPQAQKWRTARLTWDAGAETVSIGTISLSPITTPIKSRPNTKRYYRGYNVPDAIIILGGTTTVYGWVSYDECVTYTNFAVNGTASVLADGGFYTAGRTYPAQLRFREGNSDIAAFLWNKNGSVSDVYIQYFDPMFMQIRTISANTYTDTVPRPELTVDGVKIAYNDTGLLSDPKTLKAIYWKRNGFTDQFAFEGRAMSAGAANLVVGLLKENENAGTVQNFLAFSNQSNLFFAEQTNDNYSAAVTIADNTKYYFKIEWTTTAIRAYIKTNIGDPWTLVTTKTSANGNGVCNFAASPYMSIRDTTAGTYDTVEYMKTYPLEDMTTEGGATGTGGFTLNAKEDGVN